MHKGFIDKNRRLYNLRQMQVENVLPEHFAAYYPKFISLLEKYYEWQETQNSVELINHLFASRDINETDFTLLSYIEDELLLGDAYFEGFGDNETEKRAAANFSNVLFRSKGTKFAIEWFFRSFYNVDAEVLYPKENVFQVSDINSTLGPSSLRYLTDDKLYQTYALLVRVGIPISKWKDVFKLFSHPAGMYLGGEVLLSDVKNIVTALPLNDSVVVSENIPSYTLSAATGSVDEGQLITFTVNGTNVVDNTDAAFYYIENITTSQEDFLTYFDSVNPGYVSISDVAGNARGVFGIVARLDSDETESTESFRVVLRDRNGNIQDSATISLNNILTSYTLEVLGGTTTFDEGDVITFRIVGDPSNPPNQELQYYVDPIGANPISAADFVTTPPLVGSPQSINIINDSARFTLQTTIEPTSTTEPDETFRVVLSNGALVKDTSSTITIQNVVPSINLALDSDTVIEGEPLLATLTIDDFFIGTRINWALTGSIASDARATITTGSFIAEDTSTDLSIPFAVSNVYEGSVTGSLTISPEGFTPSPYTQQSFTVIDADPTYSISVDPLSAAEGDSATFTVNGTNVADGSIVYLYVDYDETDASDFVSTPPLINTRQAVTFSSNVGSPALTLQFTSNGDNDEKFTTVVGALEDSSDTTVLASREFTITSVPYTVTPNITNVNEGASVVFTVDATGLSDGTYYYRFNGTNITSDDFVDGNSGTFSMSGGEGYFTAQLAEDLSAEGTEQFYAEISSTLSGPALAASELVTINDTSSSAYLFTVDDVREGDQLSIVVTPNPVGENETLYYEISGSAVSKFTTLKTNAVTGSTTNPFTVLMPGSASTNTTYDGPIAGTVTVSRGNYVGNGGTSIATVSFNVIDAVATGVTLTPSDSTPDEGDTVTFTISGGSNVPPTLYYSVTAVQTKKTSLTSNSGQNIIYLENTTGLEVGMETTLLLYSGTITSVQSDRVFMSQNLPSTVASGSLVQFAQPAVFDDFTGYPFGSTSTSTFDIVIATDGDFTNDAYTVQLLDAQYDGNVLASTTITIQDQTGGVVDINVSTPTISDLSYNTSSTATIVFQNDGKITASGSENPGGNGIEIGTWVVGSFNPSDYTVEATITSRSGGDIAGSYGTVLSLNSSRLFSLISYEPPNLGKSTASMTVSFEVIGPGSNNSDTQSITFLTEANNLDGGTQILQ